jgi:hypothetical protein
MFMGRIIQNLGSSCQSFSCTQLGDEFDVPDQMTVGFCERFGGNLS